ncbi:MAG TPA: coenzyme F420-0:L-glutamate ligase [Terriglobales bacterium]|jgi:coenzyme F420-0:L-glutamate ligase/coenzyme F420-1:gamma-L-glutamate ligase|nr:coenzyme F420-0:L-glutamate ligase [Terriglobales bacterium]
MPVVSAIPIPGIGDILPGDSIPDIIRDAVKRSRLRFRRGDILVITHKIVSKAERQIIALDKVRPRPAAVRRAQQHKLDARVVELGLAEATRIVRRRRNVLITETAHGLVCANSGVDVSNVDGGRSAVLLPRDPDKSARQIHDALRRRLGFAVPVIITDTFGRPWREGLAEVAIGVAGMKPFRDFRAQRDPYGYALRVSLEAAADELAGMAGLACGKLSRMPACIIRGFEYEPGRGSGRDLIRARERDLFR